MVSSVWKRLCHLLCRPRREGPARHAPWWLAWLTPLTGLAALIWFLVRVIPKPSRAAYPCQRAAMPLASGFVLWLLGCIGGAGAWRQARRHWRQARYVLAGVFVAAGIAALVLGQGLSPAPADAWTPSDPPNQPMGVARGINPGRVVWIHDPDATSWNQAAGTNWWQDAYNDQTRIDAMMSRAVCWLVGRKEGQAAQAWDDLFRSFNGGAPYVAGEKIAVKLNLNNSPSQGSTGVNLGNPSPHVVLALLRQLVNVVGVAQGDITLYDGSRYISSPVYDKCDPEFPDVHYVDKKGGSGREAVVVDEASAIFYSGTPPDQPAYSGETRLATCQTQAKYFINCGILKGHNLAGVTFCTKNLFGSIYRGGSWSPKHLHTFCNVQTWSGNPPRPMGTYNPMVDLMGHQGLGGKTLLFIVDGLYAAPHQNEKPVTKWQSAPFNDDWTSSLLVSQDGVALESVALDFASAESTWSGVVIGNVDNWLHEAALADNPPSGTFYDPENDGTRLASLGVHEHWDSASTKRYSRNLGTGLGIELVTTGPPSVWRWTGEGGNSNWDNPDNWRDEAGAHGVPASSATTALTFTGGDQPAPVQNTGAPFVLNRLTFSETGAAFTISGDTLRFVADGMTAPRLVQAASQQHAITNLLDLQDALIVECTGAGALRLEGSLTGPGGLAKAGAGSLVLTGSADYDGTTTVSGGRLNVEGTLERKSSVVNVLAGGRLGGQGTIERSVNAQGGGVISPGN